jgi:hypothetical protein
MERWSDVVVDESKNDWGIKITASAMVPKPKDPPPFDLYFTYLNLFFYSIGKALQGALV